MLQMLKSRAAALAVDKGQRVLKEVNEVSTAPIHGIATVV